MTRSAELSEAAWARIEPLMPQAEGRSRPWCDHRQVVEGIVFRYRTGVAWRDLPERFGPWQTVWKRHHRFATDGTWDMLLRVIQSEADAAGRVDWSVSVDSSIVRAHQHSATARPCSGRQGLLLARDPRPPASPRDRQRDPRTRRPEGPAQAPRLTRRTASHLRPQPLPRPIIAGRSQNLRKMGVVKWVCC